MEKIRPVRRAAILLLSMCLILCQVGFLPTLLASAAEEVNVALGKPVTVSGVEGGYNGDGTLVYPQFNPQNATDGNYGNRVSFDRNDNAWLTIDLEEELMIKKIVIFFRETPTGYKVQVSRDGVNFDDVAVFANIEGRQAITQNITLETPVLARYVKYQQTAMFDIGGTNGRYSGNFSEIEVYENPSPLKLALEEIVQSNPTLAADGKSIVLPDPGDPDLTVGIFASGNTAVVDLDGKVTTPLQSMKVNIFYQITDRDGKTIHSDKANAIVVPGAFAPEESINEKPNVIPGLREWKGDAGAFTFAGRLVVADESLRESAEMTAFYLKEMLGLDAAIVGGAPAAGDIVFMKGADMVVGDEGYEMAIGDILTVTAPTPTGALYAGASITQILSQSGDGRSVPKGLVRDYPQYPVRSFMLDVARFYVPIDYLVEIGKYAAYFKLNEFHVHINETGGEQSASFRVESKKFPKINGGIISYSQEEYRNFQKEIKKFGIDTITEIDSPAHSGFVGLHDPSLMLDGYHINLSNPASWDFMKELFDEFLDGDDPVFQGTRFHIGTDEYDKRYSEIVRSYMDEMIRYVNAKGRETRFWASLGTNGFAGTTPVSTDAVAYMWSHSWASYTEMFDDGFKFINAADGILYIVPTAGYKDYLNVPNLYDTWEATNLNGGYHLDAGHPQLLGASSCLWNDVKNGHSEFDIFDRLRGQIMLMSEKTWYGEKTAGQTGAGFMERTAQVDHFTPGANPARYVASQGEIVAQYDFQDVSGDVVKDLSPNGYDATLHGLSAEGGKLMLNGAGWLSLPFDTIGFPYTVSFGMTVDASTPANAIIFSGHDGTLYYNYDNTGKLGYERKGYAYVFDYLVPAGIKLNYTILSTTRDARLFVNGYDAGNGKYHKVSANAQNSSTFVLPTERIGSGVVGAIDNFILYNTATAGMEVNLALGKPVTVSGVEGGYLQDGTLRYPQFDPQNATDGDYGTRISLDMSNNAWVTVDLGEDYWIDRVVINFNETPRGYNVQLSSNGVQFENVAVYTNLTERQRLTHTTTIKPARQARYIRYQQTSMMSIGYSGNFTELEVFGRQEIIYRTNLALDKPVTVSGVEGGLNPNGTLVYPQFNPQHATDGNEATRISLEQRDDAWLTVDLLDEYVISEILIDFLQTPTAYKVQVSSDGVVYRDVAIYPSITGMQRIKQPLPLDTPVGGRYVRYQQITMFPYTNGQSYSGNFSELEVYGRAPADKTALAQAMAAFEGLAGSQWTPATWAVAQAAYGAAALVNGDFVVEQADVDAAAQALWDALDDLEGLVFDRGGQVASVVIRKGMKYQLNIDSSNPETIVYLSSNANATVDANGLVTAVKTGSAIITVLDVWAQQYFTISINITS
ncbi:MAG: discoidin domain-containing protein [Oscillospiraceae bacterium]|nr:discoidin domain-containing protein [Oscillospiraceae bacterium]